MSSHHIVREKQEPALLIMSLEGIDPEMLGQLLEWSPTVVVTQTAYQSVESLGIKIDAVISSDPEFARQHHTRLIITENSPLEDGLKFFLGERYHAVNIIVDKFVLKDFLLYAELINLVIFTKNRKIFAIRSGFSKWQVKGQQIDILQKPANLQTSGLTQVADTAYVTKKDGFFSLTFDQPFAFISEPV